MALAEREHPRPTMGHYVNIPVLDEIYASLDDDDKATFLRWLTTKTVTKNGFIKYAYAGAWVADQISAEGHPVSEATIAKARRRGWEPHA